MSVKSFIQYTLYPDCTCWLCYDDAVLGEDHICSSCREKLRVCPSPAAPQPLDGLYVGLRYEPPLVAAIHSFKYKDQLFYAHFFTHYMNIPASWRLDCMIPVPLHPLKLWLRSYNQSEELCMALAAKAALPIRTELLKRTRYTASQTKLDSKQREKNVKNAFSASPAVAGLSVLLVDDVTTTHATLAACATALKLAGAKRVYAICACMAGY